MTEKSSDETDVPANQTKKIPINVLSDVSKPGLTPADPTSRPIIVGHQPSPGQDPLLSDGVKTKNKTSVLKLTKSKKISPINEEEYDSDIPTTAELDKARQEASQADNPVTDSDNKDSESDGNIDALANEINNKSRTKQQIEDEKKMDKHVQDLIDAKRYHLPITEGGKKAASARIVTWIFSLLLLVVIGVLLSMDAGLIDAGIDLPFDIIKN